MTSPLRPRAAVEKWGTCAQAHESVGQLNRFRPEMSRAFRGTDADREARALLLARMARENVVPAWRRALPCAGLAAVVAAAGASSLGARARRRR